MLFSTTYISESLLSGDLAAIGALKDACLEKNGAAGITGALYFDEAVFFQVLEGEYQDVMGLMETILRDPRHANVQILSGSTIRDRRFGDWNMKFVSGIANSDIANRFSKTAVMAHVDGYVNPRCLELLAV